MGDCFGTVVENDSNIFIDSNDENVCPHPQRTVLFNFESGSFKNMVDESGCRMQAVLQLMIAEENEHNHSNFEEAYLKYRQIVAKWMMDVCEYFGLHITTTHAAIAYLDRLQPNDNDSRLEWQMIAISCIMVSSKYLESKDIVPDLATLEKITQQEISKENLLKYELKTLSRLDWILDVKTAMVFLSCYSCSGVLFPNDFTAKALVVPEDLKYLIDKHFEALGTLSCLDVRFKSLRASVVAAAIVLHVRTLLNITPLWRNELVELTHYEEYALEETVNLLREVSQSVRDLCLEEANQCITETQSDDETTETISSSGRTVDEDTVANNLLDNASAITPDRPQKEKEDPAASCESPTSITAVAECARLATSLRGQVQ